MPQGLQIWDAAGNLILDTPTRTGFVIGRILINGSNQSGSLVDANLSLGMPFYFFQLTTTNIKSPPSVTFSGTTVYWTSVSGVFGGYLYYGIF